MFLSILSEIQHNLSSLSELEVLQIILAILGLILLGIIFAKYPAKKLPSERASLSNKEKGNIFEEYVAKKFDKRYFTIIAMRSDKGYPGRYPTENRLPDFKLQYNPKAIIFAVECKWRQSRYRDGLMWTSGDTKHGTWQIKNYTEYSKGEQIPVFVVLGVGGSPDAPEEIFTIPLSELTSPEVSRKFLMRFKKKELASNFFFDPNNLKLH